MSYSTERSRTAQTDRMIAVGFKIQSVAAPEKGKSPFRRIAPGQLVRKSTYSLGQFLLSIFGIHSSKHQFQPRQNHEMTNAMLKEDRNQFPHWWSL
jgi:hypothetical protein